MDLPHCLTDSKSLMSQATKETFVEEKADVSAITLSARGRDRPVKMMAEGFRAARRRMVVLPMPEVPAWE